MYDISLLLFSISFPLVLSLIFPVRLHLLPRLNSSTIPMTAAAIHKLDSSVTTTNLKQQFG